MINQEIPFQSNYSGNSNEFINSISRKDLNILLINEAENHPNVSFHFNTSCTTVDFESKNVYLKDNSKHIQKMLM